MEGIIVGTGVTFAISRDIIPLSRFEEHLVGPAGDYFALHHLSYPYNQPSGVL